VRVTSSNGRTVCATNHVRQIAAGTDVTVHFSVIGVESDTDLGEAAAYWFFVPD
jgi:hypothetical protein